MILPPPQPLTTGGKYAVFVPLVEENQELSLLFTRRAMTLRRQPGEICFPGGKIDPGESPLEAAQRELWEELGVHPTMVYGQTDYLLHRNGDLIYPVLGKIATDFACNKAEVAEFFTVPVTALRNQESTLEVLLTPTACFPKEALSLEEDYAFTPVKEKFPVYQVGESYIWGITGRITKHILSLL